MAAIETFPLTGEHMEVSGLLGADSSASHQFEPTRWAGLFRSQVQDFPGFGDDGWTDPVVLRVQGQVTIEGFIIADGSPGVPSLASSEASITLTTRTGKTLSGTFRVTDLRNDTRRDRSRIPVEIRGVFSGKPSEAWN